MRGALKLVGLLLLAMRSACAEPCEAEAVGVSAEILANAPADLEPAIRGLIREAARRGCLAAGGGAANGGPDPVAATSPSASRASEEKGSQSMVDELLWDLTHDASHKYKTERQFK